MYGGFPFGLMFLNFIGIVLFFITIVIAIKFVLRGARGYGRRGMTGLWGPEFGGRRGRHGGGRHGGGRRHGNGAGYGHFVSHGPDRGEYRRGKRGHGKRRHGKPGHGTRGHGEHGRGMYGHGARRHGTGGRHGGGGYSRGRHDRRRNARHDRPDQALDLVSLRLARGEIGTDQYQELRSALATGNASSGTPSADRGDAHGSRHGRRGGRALGIARLRFASGEIGVDEFNTIRTALEA